MISGIPLSTLNLSPVMALSGFAVALVMALVRTLHRRPLRLSSLSAVAIWYLAGTNIPVALWLCLYALSPDPPDVATKLHGCEKYVGLAGVCFLFLTVTTILMPFRRNRSPTPRCQTSRYSSATQLPKSEIAPSQPLRRHAKHPDTAVAGAGGKPQNCGIGGPSPRGA